MQAEAHLTAVEKKRAFEDTDRAIRGGGGAILRRRGIYSSTLHGWQRARSRSGCFRNMEAMRGFSGAARQLSSSQSVTAG